MAAYGRVTLNRGGRNSRFDCIEIIYSLRNKTILYLICNCINCFVGV